MKTLSEYIILANKKHSNFYDYSLIKILPKRDTKVDIICKVHGVFTQSFHKHLISSLQIFNFNFS
jgi:hypothetical protein